MITTLSWRPTGEKDADAAGLSAVLAEVPRWGTLPGRHWPSSPGAMGQAAAAGWGRPRPGCGAVHCLRGLWVMENLAMRLMIAIAATAAAVLLAAGCTAGTGHPAASPVPLPPDPHTAPALLKIATAFNHDYDTGDYGPVYTRWDARSQAIITRADYIKRHKDCPSGSHTLSQTESVSPGGPHGTWLVHYQIGGQQLTDYWFYVHRRWVFDLVLSNPDAVKLYRMSPQQYVAALGCNH
jgi:hypothetical protein